MSSVQHLVFSWWLIWKRHINKLLPCLLKVKTGDVSGFPSLELPVWQQPDPHCQRQHHCAPCLSQTIHWKFPSDSRSEKPIQPRSMPKEQEGLRELSCDETLKFAFRNQTFLTFLTLRQGHALPLMTTYSCKKGFSSYARIQKQVVWGWSWPSLIQTSQSSVTEPFTHEECRLCCQWLNANVLHGMELLLLIFPPAACVNAVSELLARFAASVSMQLLLSLVTPWLCECFNAMQLILFETNTAVAADGSQ